MALGYTQLCQESADIGVVAGLPQLVNPAGTDAEGLGCKKMFSKAQAQSIPAHHLSGSLETMTNVGHDSSNNKSGCVHAPVYGGRHSWQRHL